MKNRPLSKIIAVAVALVICLVPMLTVLSNAKAPEAVPNIFVHGLMACDIYEDPSDPDSEVIWPPKTDDILDVVKKALPELGKFIVTRDWDELGVKLTALANILFEPVVCNPDGTANGKTGVRFSYPDADSITENSVLNFRYDWRLDPIEIAAQLNDFIDYVLECSGSETVTINCHSLGGVVTETYLTIYGDSKVSGVCFNATAIYGETYTGELMTGEIVFDSDAIQNYLSYAFDYNEYNALLDAIIELVNKAGLMDFIVKFGNDLVKYELPYVARESLMPLFGGWLSIWAMVSDDKIDEAKSFVFDAVYEGQDYSALKARVDRYDTLVRKHKAETLRALNSNANVYVISRYGYSSLPLTPSHTVVGDGVIDTKNTSFGATVAPYGTALSDEQLTGVDAKYISPDKTVDASTCMFPEQTWFIRGMQHANNPTSLDNMVLKLLRYDGQATVDTFEEYTRFCEYDHVNDVISPYTQAKAEPNFFGRIVILIKQLVALISSLFKK